MKILLSCLIIMLIASSALAAKDTVGMEMSADGPIIIFADKYVSKSSMLHFWAIPGAQTNILFRQNLSASKPLPKFEIGAGPTFAVVNDHQVWAYYSVEMETQMQLGPLKWLSYRLGQLSREDNLHNSALLREQFFYADFPLGIVGNNNLAQGQKPRPFWGLVYSFGRTSYFGTNKFFLTINLADTDQVWAAWLIQI